MKPSTDGWHNAKLPPLPEGINRLTLTGGRDINPATDLFSVVDIGTDTEA